MFSSKIHPAAAATGGERPGDPTDPEAVTRALLEKSPLLVYIADLDFRIALINRGLRELCGYDTTECPNVESLLRRFYPDERYRSVVSAIHEGWRRNEHIRGAELVVQCRDGQQRTISWSTARLKVARGNVHGYIAVGVDVTTRRSLEQWVSLLQKSLQHVQEGVILTDPLGRVLAWNQGAQRLLGFEERAMQGRFLSELYQRTEREMLARSIDRAVEATGIFAGEVELERVDGRGLILPFQQHRIDGEGGAALARLTILSAGGDGGTSSVRADLQRASAEIERLQTTLNSTRAEVAERDERVRARDRAIEELRSLAEAATAGAGADLQRAMEDLQKRTVDAETRLASVARQAEESERQARDAEDRAATAAVESAEAASRAQGAEEELAAARQALAEAEKRADAAAVPDPALLTRVSDAEASAALARDEAEQSANRCVILEEALQKAEAALDQARSELTAARQSHEALLESSSDGAAAEGARADADRTRIASLEVELDAHRAAREESERAAERRAAEAQENHESALAALRTENDAAVSALLNAHDERLATLRGDHDAAVDAMREAHRLALEEAAVERERAVAEARDAQAEADAEAADELRARLAAKDAEAATLAEAADSRLAALSREHGARGEELEARSAQVAELEAALQARLSRITELETLAAEATARADAAGEELRAAEERRHTERAAIDEEHRLHVASTIERAAEERRALEEQLTRDILAAEERAEADRQSLQRKLEQQAQEYADASTILRAEGEGQLRSAQAEFSAEIDRLRHELQRTPNLGAFAGVVEDALVCIDTEGRIVGFSSGAAALAGKHQSEVLGTMAHEGCLTLPGLDWRTLFGRVVVSGRLHQRLTVETARGPREFELHATLVKHSSGRPLGVVERFLEPKARIPAEAHGYAAIGQCAAVALPEALAAIEDARLAFARAAQHHRGLVDLAKDVDRAGTTAELESTARKVDLRRLLAAGPADDRALEAALQRAVTAVRDLEEGSSWAQSTSIRWNELVDRCVAAGSHTPGREYGEAGLFSGPVSVAASAVLVALDGAALVRTSKSEALLRAEFVGSTADVDFTDLRARAAGGRARKDGETLVLELPSAPEFSLVEGPWVAPSAPAVVPSAQVVEAPVAPSPAAGSSDSAEIPARSGEVVVVADAGGIFAMAGEDSVAGPMPSEPARADAEVLEPDPPSDADGPVAIDRDDAVAADDVELQDGGDASFAERPAVSSDLFDVARDVSDFQRGGFEVSDELGDLEVEASAEDPAEESAVEVAGDSGDDADEDIDELPLEEVSADSGDGDSEGEGDDEHDRPASSAAPKIGSPPPPQQQGKKKKKKR